MHCQLLIPQLFWPDPALDAVYEGLRLPALERLLARGRRRIAPGRGYTGWLTAQFGLAPDATGAAALRLRGEGIDPGGASWLCADPVHLAVGLKGIRLTDPAALKLSAAEAAALGQALNAHFAPEGLTFQAPHPRRWYVRLPQGLAAPRTTAPEHALGPVEESSLPAGDAGARWRSCMNEAQMLLHEHPVNRAREQSGEPPINGVWLWGGGSPPAPAARPGTECWLAADPLVRGLALAAGARAANLPGTWSGRAPPGPGIHWHVLEQARAAAAAGDPQAWHAALMDLETHWFAPLLDALAQGSLGMVSIHAVSPGQTLSVEVTRSDLRHVWRRARALKAYVNLNAPAEAR